MKNALLIAALSSLLVACGGGGSDDGTAPAPAPAPAPVPAPAPAPPPAADTTPPTILSFRPDATGRVPRTSEVSARFSESLSADTITAANLGVTRSGTATPGTPGYESSSHTVTFVPQRPFDLLASYTVTAGTGFRDLAGNSLAAEQSWTFATADGSWQAPRQLDGADAKSLSPDVAMDPDGNAMLVWASEAASGWHEIRSAARAAGGEWSSVRTLSTPGNYYAFDPTIRIDIDGNALAVWTQSDDPGVSASVWSARYLKGQGWQAAVQVDAYANVGPVSLALDAGGNAFAVWARPTGPGLQGNSDIWAARFTPGGGWQPSTRLGSAANIGTYDQAAQPQVVIDRAGDAHVVWVQTASDSPVWYAHYRSGSGWRAAVSLGAARLGDPYGPRIAVSDAGQVLALWNTFVYAGGPYRFDLWSSFLDAEDGSWSTPALVENRDAGNALRQSVAVDPAGRFHAVWQQHASTYQSDILYRQYTPGAGWGATKTISVAQGTYDQNQAPAVVADRNGNLMVLWTVYASGYGGAQEGTFARRQVAGEGWKPTLRVDAGAGERALATSLAVGADGSIAAAWMQPGPFRSDGPVWVNTLE